MRTIWGKGYKNIETWRVSDECLWSNIEHLQRAKLLMIGLRNCNIIPKAYKRNSPEILPN